MSEYDCIGITSEYLYSLKNKIKELEQQNKELIEALNSACLNCHRFCDEECHAYFIKHKFTIGGER